MTRSGAGVVAILAWLLPGTLAAQVEVVLDAGIGAYAGGDFAGTPSGPALGAAIHIPQEDSVQAGFEFGYSRHRGGALESATTQLEYLGLVRFPVLAGPLELFVGGKLGVGHRSLRVVDEHADADGFIVGPSAALRFPIASLHLQLTFDALYETYEELWMYGQREYGTDKDGLRLVLRAGLAFPLMASRRRSQLPL